MLPSDILGWLTFLLKHVGPLVILIIGCICVYALQRVPDLRSTPLFCIVRVLMIIDLVHIIATKIHDIPDEIADRELFDSVTITVIVIIQCIRWFAQLLALPMLSSLHFLSLYRPVKFRQLRLIHGYSIVALFLTSSVLLTIPILTNCCGFTYYVDGAFWAFDFGKPGTALYTQLNLVLQVICVIMMLVCDIFILYKVFNMRNKALSTTINATQQTPVSEHAATTNTPIVARTPLRPPRKASVEKKLTMSFLLLSLSFIVPTICFNLRPVYQDWAVSGLIGAACLVIEDSKWFVYTLTITLIRKEFVQILKCKVRR